VGLADTVGPISSRYATAGMTQLVTVLYGSATGSQCCGLKCSLRAWAASIFLQGASQWYQRRHVVAVAFRRHGGGCELLAVAGTSPGLPLQPHVCSVLLSSFPCKTVAGTVGCG
jgi:hypothetical protein